MPSFLQKFGLGHRTHRAWAMYDWANSAFITSISTVFMPIYFFDVVAKGMDPQKSTMLWGVIASLSILLIAILGPVFSVFSDFKQRRKPFIFACMLIGSLSSVALYTVGEGDLFWAVFLFGLGSVAFAAGNVFYEAMLPHICKDQEEVSKVSVAGYAIGYLGGGVLLALHLLLLKYYALLGVTSTVQAVQICFVSVGFWWFVFSLLLFLRVPESVHAPQSVAADANSNKLDLVHFKASLFETIKTIWETPKLFYFLMAFYLYSDGVWTIIKMATTYGRQLGIESESLVGAVLLVQLLGVPASFAFIPLARYLEKRQTGGELRLLRYSLLGYAMICLFSFNMSSARDFWILAVFLACVQGGTQAVGRSVYAGMIPPEKSSEFFSFFTIANKFAGVLGPLLFSLSNLVTGSSKWATLSLTLFFLIAIWILKYKVSSKN